MHSSSTCSIAAAALAHVHSMQDSRDCKAAEQQDSNPAALAAALLRCCAVLRSTSASAAALQRCTVVQFCGAAVLQLIAARFAPCCLQLQLYMCAADVLLCWCSAAAYACTYDMHMAGRTGVSTVQNWNSPCSWPCILWHFVAIRMAMCASISRSHVQR